MSDSELETAFLYYWKILAPEGVPDPVREYEGAVPGRKFRCDFAWPGSKVVVEVDGGTHAKNGGRHNSDRDRQKINLLTLHGWKVFRYSGRMIFDTPEATIEEVATAVLGLKVRT